MKKKDAVHTGKLKESKSQLRPPIVSVLGHVDHGKTTLLDKVRKTNIAQKEAGGITQSIGASTVVTKEGKKITFIDTPGHAAFAKMRSRGANVADIAILVIAANDGVKPQTREALRYIKEAKTPYVVAITKVDLPVVDVESVRDQLEKEGIKIEEKGGDVPVVNISGKTGKGIDDLLEMISLVSEVNEIKVDKKKGLEAVVVESDKDKRGPIVSVVLRNGTLKIGDEISANDVCAKVRGLFNDKAEPIKQVNPGEPAQILGFAKLPPVGSRVEKLEGKLDRKKEEVGNKAHLNIEKDKTPVVIKAKSAGCLEAIIAGVPSDYVVISSGVGDVNENDVFLAKSKGKGLIVAFESKVPTSVLKLAGTEGVTIEKFKVIYELFDKLEEKIKEKQVETFGEAQVLAIFPFNNKQVAGCKVTSGVIKRSDRLLFKRDKEELGEVKIITMKREKKNIEEAKSGEEFGIITRPQLDFKIGDVILSIR